MPSKDLLRGTMKTIVLKLLSENGKMYGYEITQKVKELSNGQLEIKFGALYPILHKLEAEGELITETVLVENRARKYYQLTKKGNETVKVKLTEFNNFVEAMKLILNPSAKTNLNLWGI
ncbi:MAG: PadR family transcriptional regulator [Flammeovirgaceae bacterium]|nr:PadR family transcriptional regulator [Flammeovirgaceae bacterium]